MISHPNRNKRRPRAVAPLAPREQRQHDHDYSGLLAGVSSWFQTITTGADALFETDASDLNAIYLRGIPARHRQVHDCSACRRFIEKFGGLVVINQAGETRSAMWNPEMAPEFYKPAFGALADVVQRAKVTSVFLDSDKTWGTPQTGPWTHISVAPPPNLVYAKRGFTAGQASAAVRENVKTVTTALAEFSPELLEQALRVLDGDHVSRAEKFVEPVRWLLRLHGRPKGKIGHNVLWSAVAVAPEGFCHPRASVVGSLLEDIAAGLPFDQIKSRFDAKLHPLRYQRPQAAPAAGNIAAAEKLVEKLGIANSLERRFARIDEIEKLWWHGTATEARAAPGGGVFAHIKPKAVPAAPTLDLPETTMTWEKFSSKVLESAKRIEMLVPHTGNFIALVTAEHFDAPPIMKWDRDEVRNPVSLYVYHGGSPASRWRLTAGWTEVTAVAAYPWMWGNRPTDYLGKGAVLVLAGAVDTNDGGNALFPEMLRSELHGARATIEAYSKTAKVGGREQASACGHAVGGNHINIRLRAFVDGAWSAYRIDRWD